MKWGLVAILWLALLLWFIYQCFRLLPKGQKKELRVFGGWLLLLGILISLSIHSTPADPRFADLVLQYFR